MFTLNQDYIMKNSKTPVLTRQQDGKFEFKDCYFLEIVIKQDNETMNRINTVCAPFDFITSVQNAISEYNNNILRLFILAGPDIIKNKFKEPDDFLALALCNDEKQRTNLQYFEVNCKFRHSYDPNQKYRCVGTSAVKALKEIYKSRELYGKSALHALKFWFKNGFTRIDESEQYVHWNQR